MRRRGFLLVALVLLAVALGGVASAERTSPIRTLRIDEVTLLDLDGGTWLNDILVNVTVELQGGKDSLELTLTVTYPSGAVRVAEFEIKPSPSGLTLLNLKLLNWATEPGWYTVTIEAAYNGYDTITDPFPFDPEGGSIGPSGI